MEIWQQILPYIGWVIAGTVAVSLGGILASVHNTRLKIKHGYPIEGMWGQSLKPGSDAESKERIKLLTHENAELRAELGDELKAVTLFTTVNRAGGVFLWAVRLPDATGRRSPWAESARRGAELAMHSWMRISANRAAGEYDLFEAAATLPEPEWPVRKTNSPLRTENVTSRRA